MEIRVVKKEDAKAIRDIYAPYVLDTIVTFEYEVPDIEEMERRIEKTLQRYPYFVAVIDDKVVGYAYASSFHERKAYDWACELSVYVDRDIRGQGVGKALYEELFKYLKLMNMKALYACLGYPNEASEKFHQSFGFKTIGYFHKCGYKFNQWIDMIWMEKHFDDFDHVKDIIPFLNIYNS